MERAVPDGLIRVDLLAGAVGSEPNLGTRRRRHPVGEGLSTRHFYEELDTGLRP